MLQTPKTGIFTGIQVSVLLRHLPLLYSGTGRFTQRNFLLLETKFVLGIHISKCGINVVLRLWLLFHFDQRYSHYDVVEIAPIIQTNRHSDCHFKWISTNISCQKLLNYQLFGPIYLQFSPIKTVYKNQKKSSAIDLYIELRMRSLKTNLLSNYNLNSKQTSLSKLT